MSEFREHRPVLDAARKVSRIIVDSNESQSAVDAVRARMFSASHPARPQSRRRIVLAGALAAAAAVILALVLPVGLFNGRVAAAERLQQAAQATRAYRGWVHERMTVSPALSATTRPATTRPATSQPATPQPFWSQPSVRVMHRNTVDDVSVHETHLDGRVHVDMKIPAKRLWYIYDPADNELRIAEIRDVLAASFADNEKGHALTLSEWLDGYIAQGGAKAATQTREGDLTRFDLTDTNSGGDFKASIWVDPATKLIRKHRFESAEGVLVSEISYGAPEIGEPYDAGVPRDAKVVDGRPASEVAKVVDRLHLRAVDAFGDGVALLTQERFWKKDKPGTMDGDMTLFARQGNRSFRARYFVMGVPRNPNAAPQSAVISGVPHWPNPTLDDAMAAIKDSVPVKLTVVNGAETWDGGSTRDLNGFEWKGRMGVAQQNLYLRGVGALIWPLREYTGLNAPGTKATLVSDEARPGLIGLRVELGKDIEPIASIRLPSQRIVYWFDPARDDMPVETVNAENPPADGDPRDFLRTVFKEFAQLPDGRWYPTRWEAQSLKEGKVPEKSVTLVYRLSVFPEARMSDEWFFGPPAQFGGSRVPDVKRE